MKNTIRTLSAGIVVMLAILLATAAAPATKAAGPEGRNAKASHKGKVAAVKISGGTSEELRQCGVTLAQVQTYLETCSHHHTVYSVWDVPGSCNSQASIENCKTSTVYVQDGQIVGHQDSGFCGSSPTLGPGQ